MAVFDRGDVVSVPLAPAFGHEQKGIRPVSKARRVERVPPAVSNPATTIWVSTMIA